MTNWFDVISNPDVRFYDINGKELTLDEVKEFTFNPAEMQFPAGHGMFVSHYFLSFWSTLLGDDTALFYLKLIDGYIYGGEKDFCFPSVGTIAKDLNMSPNTVRSRLKKLEEFGFVARFNVQDTSTGQYHSSLIKIRMDIPLIPDNLLCELPSRIQEGHQKYMNRVKKPATILADNIFCAEQEQGSTSVPPKPSRNRKTDQQLKHEKGVMQNLNKGGTSNFEQGGASNIEQGGTSIFEAPYSNLKEGGTSNSEGGVLQTWNPNLLPINNLKDRSPNGDDVVPVNPVESKIIKNSSNKKQATPKGTGDSRVKEAILNHCRLFRERFNTAYLPVWNKEGKQIKTILTSLDHEYPENTSVALQEIFNMQEQFFNTKDEWIINSGYTIGAFIVSVNKLRKDKANKPDLSKSIDKLKKQKLIKSLYCN